MEYTVKALAELAGVTPRTLRWYHQKGLLKPLRTTEAGYRLYGPAEVDRLQTILFYRELGLSLAAIGQMLDASDFNRLEALQSHLAALESRRQRLDALILTVQKTMDEVQGGNSMSDKEKFEAFKRRAVEANETQYGREIRENYGDETVDRATACLLSLTEADYRQWKDLGEKILRRLEEAVRTGADPAGEAGRTAAELHRRWLSFSWETYSPQAHRGLAALYTADARFTAYYDRKMPGCAAFLRRAVEAHVS